MPGMFQVWPYLLGHYRWNFRSSQMNESDLKARASYENKLSDWMAIEAIVRQKDKETTAANIAKLSGAGMWRTLVPWSEQNCCHCNYHGINTVSVSVDNLSCVHSINLSNEVFESIDEPISSRTVSADKISTITEVRHPKHKLLNFSPATLFARCVAWALSVI